MQHFLSLEEETSIIPLICCLPEIKGLNVQLSIETYVILAV